MYELGNKFINAFLNEIIFPKVPSIVFRNWQAFSQTLVSFRLSSSRRPILFTQFRIWLVRSARQKSHQPFLKSVVQLHFSFLFYLLTKSCVWHFVPYKMGPKQRESVLRYCFKSPYKLISLLTTELVLPNNFKIFLLYLFT